MALVHNLIPYLLILFPALVVMVHIRHTSELTFNHTDVILLAIYSTDFLFLGLKFAQKQSD